MKLDLSCPIEVRGYTLTYSGTKAEASVRLFNLSEHRIEAIEAIAKWRCGATNQVFASPFSVNRLHAAARDGFYVALTTDHLPSADSVELLFRRVRFEDGDEWCGGDGPFAEIEPLPAIESGDLDALRAIAGADAVCYPKQDSQTWRCVCGRINSNSTESCVRCRRDHFTAISLTQESVRARREEASALPAQEAELAELHARYLRQRSKTLHRALLAAAAALALTVLLTLGIHPHSPANQYVAPASEMTAVDR